MNFAAQGRVVTCEGARVLVGAGTAVTAIKGRTFIGPQ